MSLYYTGNYRTEEQLTQMLELEAAGVELIWVSTADGQLPGV